MGLACLSLPVTDPVEEFVNMVEKAARQWADEQKELLEVLARDTPPSLRELAEAGQATRRDLLGALLLGGRGGAVGPVASAGGCRAASDGCDASGWRRKRSRRCKGS